MTRPKFVVQHFLVCQDALWMGVPGPRTLRTLEGVGYHHTIPAHAEMPELDFWVYVRLFLTNNVSGRRKFWVRLIWTDAPRGPRRVRTYPLSHVRFSAPLPVTDVAFPLRGVQFPGRGRYEFL